MNSRKLLTLTLAMLALFAMIFSGGCVATGPAYNQLQHTGAIGQDSTELTNRLMNIEYQQRMLGAYSENAHRQALDTYGSQSRDQVMGNASETAIRNAQGIVNSEAAGGDIRSARKTGEEVNEQMLQMLKAIRESQSDMQGEINRLKTATPGAGI